MHCSNLWLLLVYYIFTCLLLGFLERPSPHFVGHNARRSYWRVQKLGLSLALIVVCFYCLPYMIIATRLILQASDDAPINNLDAEEIKDQQKKCNELPGIHCPNLQCFCRKTECCKAMWCNPRVRRACTHCGQFKEYPTLPIPPLPTPLPPKISFHISSCYQFIFVYLIFENLILHSRMFWDVPCSRLYWWPSQAHKHWEASVNLYLRLPCTIRGVSHASDVVRPVYCAFQ